MHVINQQMGPHSDEHDYLELAAELLMKLGMFHLLFSIFSAMSMCLIMFSPKIDMVGENGLLTMLNFSESPILQALVYGYVIFQALFGWAIGFLTMRAGRDCLHTHSWHFVIKVIMLNWFVVPVGTVLGIIIWRDLRHKGIRNFFDDV